MFTKPEGQPVVDRGRRYRGMTFGHHDLMQVRDDVASGVETVDRGLLLVINDKTPGRVGFGAQGRCQVGMDPAAQRGIEDVKSPDLPILQNNRNTTTLHGKAFGRRGKQFENFGSSGSLLRAHRNERDFR